MSHSQGFFLTIEGIEGAGKSSLAELLQQELESRGWSVVVTAEPGGDAVGQRIRSLLLDPGCTISDRAELLLFEAARAQHVDTTIVPALERGSVVICDRYADSSLAYQGYGRGIDLQTVAMLNDYATGGLRPDLTILLDLPVEAGLARQKRVDRVSQERMEFHEAVRQGFLAIAKSEPNRVQAIGANQEMEEVYWQALKAVMQALNTHSASLDAKKM